jgi:hypothetical protein
MKRIYFGVVGHLALAAALLVPGVTVAQVRLFQLGTGANTWASGGNGGNPQVLVKKGSITAVDSSNAPGAAIEYGHRGGWITPRFFDGQTNISSLLLDGTGSIKAPNSLTMSTALRRSQLEGIINGDHSVAFERKPSPFAETPAFGIWVIMDFARLVGIKRIRFYPRNTVVATPRLPFHGDFLRGYELFINERITDRSGGAPDVLVSRVAQNIEAIVDIPIEPQYVRLIKLRSITTSPFEIDEIEVFGTGYLGEAAYYSDVIDLGHRSAVGAIRWVADAIGDPIFSELGVRARTGADDSPVLYRRRDVGDFGVELTEVTPEEYWELKRANQAALADDKVFWSPWKSLENGAIAAVPGPRRYIQLRVDFEGRLFDTRAVERLQFDYLNPPLADTLKAEVFPRLAETEEAVSFHYGVMLRGGDDILGFDQLEVDTNVPIENIRDLTINGEPTMWDVDFNRNNVFRISFPLVRQDSSTVEFSFDVPIFRFGSVFSGRAINSRFPTVPQRLGPGQVVDFGPGDFDAASGFTVVIPKPQIGRLVGEVIITNKVFTPNGDGVNEQFGMDFNILQLVQPAPVALDIYDLSARRVCRVFEQERGIGPASLIWDGRLADGSLATPGNYIWVLRVMADAFEERHQGVLCVVY